VAGLGLAAGARRSRRAHGAEPLRAAAAESGTAQDSHAVLGARHDRRALAASARRPATPTGSGSSPPGAKGGHQRTARTLRRTRTRRDEIGKEHAMNETEFNLRNSLRTTDTRMTGPQPTTSQSSGGDIGLLYKELSYAITGAAIEVHKHLGPGQLESTYERALAKELGYRGIEHQCQVPITAYFKGDAVGEFCADMIVDDKVILELKSVVKVLPVHRAQVLSYLRATGLRLGLLINFYEPVLWRAVKRVVL
jgi:GxxExxY protein